MHCEVSQTTGELYTTIFKNYSKILENEVKKTILERDYVLKFRGIEEYLIDKNSKLYQYETIRKMLRTINQKIDLVLVERKSLPIKNWEKLTDYYENVRICELLLFCLI